MVAGSAHCRVNEHTAQKSERSFTTVHDYAARDEGASSSSESVTGSFVSTAFGVDFGASLERRRLAGRFVSGASSIVPSTKPTRCVPSTISTYARTALMTSSKTDGSDGGRACAWRERASTSAVVATPINRASPDARLSSKGASAPPPHILILPRWNVRGHHTEAPHPARREAIWLPRRFSRHPNRAVQPPYCGSFDWRPGRVAETLATVAEPFVHRL